MSTYYIWLGLALFFAFLFTMCGARVWQIFLGLVLGSIPFILLLNSYGWTEAQRLKIRTEDERLRTINQQPVTYEQKLADGCKITWYYSRGLQQGSPVIFTQCPKAEVSTLKSYSCGSAKVPRTCTQEVRTSEQK